MTQRTCEDCALCFLVDYGYSNYTVEGTNVHCGVNAHPSGPFDRWYGGDTRLTYAQQCESFTPGGAFHVDVDHDCFDKGWRDQKMTVAQHILWHNVVDTYLGSYESATKGKSKSKRKRS